MRSGKLGGLLGVGIRQTGESLACFGARSADFGLGERLVYLGLGLDKLVKVRNALEQD